MPPLFTLYEPAPAHPAKMGFGRGGAGNRTHPIPPSMLSSPLTRFTSNTANNDKSSSAKAAVSSGRGGAGNMHTVDEDHRLFSFDEELERQVKRSEACAPVYHIGRGGQGNLVDEKKRRRSSGSDASDKKGNLEWIKGIAGRKGSS